jgi:hypothetical protein
MSELVKWADVVEEIFELGRLYGSLRGGPRRSLIVSKSENGVWTAAWTNQLPDEEDWAIRMHGHDKEHALQGLRRRLQETNASLSSAMKQRDTPLPASSRSLRAAPVSSPAQKKK